MARGALRCCSLLSSVARLILGRGNCADLEKHGYRFGAVPKQALHHGERRESIAFIEGDSLRFGVDDDADTPEVTGHRPCKDEHGLEEAEPHAAPLRLLIHGQSSEPEHGKRIVRQATMLCGRESSNLDLRGRHRRKPHDGAVIVGNVGRTDGEAMSPLRNFHQPE